MLVLCQTIVQYLQIIRCLIFQGSYRLQFGVNYAQKRRKPANISFTFRMKEIQRSLSPIPKIPRMRIYCEEIADRIDLGHCHQLSIFDSLEWTHLQQKLTNAAKTIVYLFTPDIELLQSLENNLSNFDKYQRTRLIIKQLVNSIHENRFELQTEVFKTHQEMQNLQQQINQLKVIITQLERQCLDNNKTIQEQRQTILRLTEAYSQAKHYYQQEIEELKQQSDQFRINVTTIRYENRSNSKEKSQEKLQVLKQKQRKKSDLFTDRSMYQRFRASNLNETQNEGQEHSKPFENSQINHFVLKIQNLSFEKEALERKLEIAQQQYKKLALLQVQMQQKQQRAKDTNDEKQGLDLLRKKLCDKNRIIEELLAVIEGKA